MKNFLIHLIILFFLLIPSVLIAAAIEEQNEGMILNFNDVDIRSVIKSVARLTNKNFIIDPAVKGKVTIVSSQPMAGEEIYGVFLSILQVYNYTAVESGDLVNIVPIERKFYQL